MSELRIDASQNDDGYVICLQGELDFSECAGLETALAEAEVSQASRILLDLEELEFIDSGGLETLLEASRRSARNGRRLRVTKGNGIVADLFRLIALDLTLPLVDPR